jgi:phospholipid-binding lipoprotein MlaA
VRRSLSTIIWLAVGLMLAGCGTFTSTLRSESAVPPVTEVEPAAVIASAPRLQVVTSDEGLAALPRSISAEPAAAPLTPIVIAQATTEPGGASDADDEYDPWEKFNEKMFTFNYNLDRYLLKPVARGYRAVLPEQVQIMIDNGFSNIAFVPRFVNSLLQGKWEGALREVSRFVVNSTLGFGGLFDAAKTGDLKPSREDFGQTLGVWGVGPGPYLVIPFIGPMTVRDGIGRGIDGAMNPLNYFIPYIWDGIGMKIGETVNDRALNYELFQGVEETTIDLYSSVRHFYLKRREQMIKE